MMTQSVQLLNRFKGSLVGALVGDCLGSFFETDGYVSDEAVFDHFQGLKAENKKQIYKYTDDTAMTRQVAESLIEKRGYDARNMADRFQREFYLQPWRGYGGNVGTVFSQLRAQFDSDDPDSHDVYEPARLQFDGSGSYGNGGAMRIAPAALFNYNTELEDCETMVTNMTRITHSHNHAILGAILEHHAVRQALHLNRNELESPSKSPKGKIRKLLNPSENEAMTNDSLPAAFIDLLLARMVELEKEKTEESYDDDFENVDRPDLAQKTRDSSTKLANYCDKLNAMKDMLQDEAVDYDDVVRNLGHGIAAFQSVPTAVYAFLRCLKPVVGLDELATNAFERTIIYAIRLGGDTDTIANMAGAIAGAYYGFEAIPDYMIRHSEAVADALEQADKLHRIVIPGNR